MMLYRLLGLRSARRLLDEASLARAFTLLRAQPAPQRTRDPFVAAAPELAREAARRRARAARPLRPAVALRFAVLPAAIALLLTITLESPVGPAPMSSAELSLQRDGDSGLTPERATEHRDAPAAAVASPCLTPEPSTSPRPSITTTDLAPTPSPGLPAPCKE